MRRCFTAASGTQGLSSTYHLTAIIASVYVHMLTRSLHQSFVVTFCCMMIHIDAVSPPCPFTFHSLDLSLRVWCLGSRQCLDTFYGHTSTPLCLDIVGSDRPVSGGADSTVRLWKPSTESHLLYHWHQEPVDAIVQLNPARTASGSQDGCICLWSPGSRKPVATLRNAHGGNWITALVMILYDIPYLDSDGGRFSKKEGTCRDSFPSVEWKKILLLYTLSTAGVLLELLFIRCFLRVTLRTPSLFFKMTPLCDTSLSISTPLFAGLYTVLGHAYLRL